MNTGIGLMILGVMVAVVGVAGFGGYANRGFKLGGLRSSTPEPGGGGGKPRKKNVACMCRR